MGPDPPHPPLPSQSSGPFSGLVILVKGEGGKGGYLRSSYLRKRYDIRSEVRTPPVKHLWIEPGTRGRSQRYRDANQAKKKLKQKAEIEST